MYYVYILRCGDGSFYTGSTPDVAKRLALHRAGKGAKYTKGRRPLQLVYEEACADKNTALRREIAIKRLSRQEKQRLIQEGPPAARAAQAVKERLAEFLAIYQARELDAAVSFVAQFFCAEAVVYGTSAGEQCRGRAEIAALVADDWQHWGRLELELDQAHLHITAESVGFLTTGCVRWDAPPDGVACGEAGQAAGLALPLHLSGLFCRRGAVWLIAQLHFAYVTTAAALGGPR